MYLRHLKEAFSITGVGMDAHNKERWKGDWVLQRTELVYVNMTKACAKYYE